MAWDEVTTARLKELWSEGLSAAQIVHRLNREFPEGFTRNAVIGKIYRSGLNRQRGTEKHKPKPRVKRANGSARGKANKPKYGGRLPKAAPHADGEREVANAPPASSPLPPIDETAMNKPLDGTKGCQIEDLTERRCKWPVYGQGVETAFCGASKSLSGPYCEFHEELAHAKPTPAQRREGRRRAREAASQYAKGKTGVSRNILSSEFEGAV